MIKHLLGTSNGRRNEHVEDKRAHGAIAVCVANNGLNGGCFDYDVRDGEIRFRLTSGYRERTLGAALFEYMIKVSISAIDRYNDKFFMIAKGNMALQRFIEQENS